MHRDGKWARQITEWQREDGSWGDFHSLAVSGGSRITTEQALRRLEILGCTMEDECIRKAVGYMNDCLVGEKTIPDREEKVHDWSVFTSLLLATGIRRFTKDNDAANRVAGNWAEIVTAAFDGGSFDYDRYVTEYKSILCPNGGRIIGIENYYPVSLLCGCLDEKTELAFVEHILNFEKGIYYIYDRPVSVLPQEFRSRNASNYLGAVELLIRYKRAGRKLEFVADWLLDNRGENGKWDMGKTVSDKRYFPLSDDWRKDATREADCTERIEKILHGISGG